MPLGRPSVPAEPDGRRQRRGVAQGFFDELAVGLLARQGVDSATMFGSAGLRFDTRFFAFVGGVGDLIVKLPAAQAAGLAAAGVGAPARIGRGEAREWFAAQWACRDRWQGLIDDAYRYASGR